MGKDNSVLKSYHTGITYICTKCHADAPCAILFMTSNECIIQNTVRAAPEREKMREYRRPTLCVIDENGFEIAKDDEIKGLSGSDVDNHGNEIKVSLNDYSRDCNGNVTNVENNRLLCPNIEKDLDLSELKATAARLKLSTRRQSTVAWQQRHLNATRDPVIPKFDLDTLNEHKDDSFTEERKKRINEALAWLRTELQQMRNEDEVLARKLLSIRHDIHQLKLQRSCEEHQDMLDDVTMDMEENDELHEISDFPITDSMHDTPLKHLGVTKMHLSARRFSTC
ncbi:protein FAM167A-like [Mercenaria mercenaria]|uniref:protein FAM167A-like n=1 Tax=Mercenaria mercenaria TaxID=6596 RepID=UPI00234F4FE3|nr:protein FAM167A-like [Mercenaria mercenaria]